MKVIAPRFTEPEVDVTLTRTEVIAIRKALSCTADYEFDEAGVSSSVAHHLYGQFYNLQQSL